MKPLTPDETIKRKRGFIIYMENAHQKDIKYEEITEVIINDDDSTTIQVRTPSTQ